MSLLVVHKVLIASALVLGLVLAAWAVFRYRAGAGGSYLAVAALGLCAAAALAWYFRTIDRRYARLPRR